MWDDDNGTDSGSAYLFDTVSGNLLQKLTAPDGASGDFFGHSVALDGDSALIGTPLDDDNGIDSGSAYLFKKTTDPEPVPEPASILGLFTIASLSMSSFLKRKQK